MIIKLLFVYLLNLINEDENIITGDQSQMRQILKLNRNGNDKDLFKIEMEYKKSVILEYYQSF